MANTMTSSQSQDEFQSIQHQIHEKKTGILDSTRRMLGLINESEVVGAGTATQLVEQREKLENIDRRCDEIDSNLVSAQQNINKLDSIFGGIKNYFRPPKSSFTKSTSQPHLSDAATKKKLTAATVVNSRPTNNKDDSDTYFGKSRSAMDDIERETDDGLHDIHLGVNRLKLLALQMNEELETQKPLTDRVAVKVDRLTNSVTQKNDLLRKNLLR